ncbi:RNA polymerase sigma factor [Paenibacillus eucommiae]|uniref:RNA polymerase sigma-70 factor (ECF subfamily) n=1 Tax=Paenibacillus eucommiae TaxID=1355755 RepID=A0ABS4J7E0_9BACL|nr:RNA polymerase sigma factor [Paenibacillus eucommiae]MBP1995728.1 RNA polymerase sigma-70 factor (ECF subfamily) [Paenibacillus eucommiae]
MNNGKEQQGRSKVESFQILYARYFKQVYYSAFSITKDRELAHDVVQETFLKAYRHFDSLKQHDQKEAWLKVVSRNVAIDMYRKRCRELSSYRALRDADRSETDVERTIVDQEFLSGLLSSLEPIYRQSLLLVYEYGLTYEQLADCQQTSIGAVKSRIHRAKQKLRGAALQMETNVGVPAHFILRQK